MIDTTPHPAFRRYSAGNFAEVAPERISPIAWSLIGDPVERGNRALVTRLWPNARWQTGSHFVFVGYFRCRPFHNLTAYGHLARQIPRLDPSLVSSSYFEGTALPPVHRGHDIGIGGRLAGLPRLVRELASLRPRLRDLEGQVALLEQERGRAHQAGTIPIAACLTRARNALDLVWDLHYSNTMALVPLRGAQRGLAARHVPYWDALEGLVNRPRELPWPTLHGDAETRGRGSPGEFLDHGFYEVADAQIPWSEYVRRSPRPAAASASGPVREHQLEDPWSMVPHSRRRMLPQASALIADTMAGREGSKALAMRLLHVFRRSLPVLAREIGVAEHDWPYLTVDELLRPHEHEDLVGRAATRAQACAQALELPMPDVFDAGSDLPDAASASLGTTVPRGVSPGTATGVVVTPDTIDDYTDAKGRVLVCDTADADIQPVLARVDGVLTARGSVLSHVAILVREQGIPAVVGWRGAMALFPGQRILINGTTGEVELLDG